MRIFAAGIITETNTFAPVPTSLGDFAVQRGRDVPGGRVEYPGLDLTAIWGRQAQARGDEFIFSLMAFAQPFGVTVRSAYESVRDEILRDLQAAMPVSVVLLNLHGAMVADGYDDCEEDIIRRVRAIVGNGTTIGVELDLHCHLSDSKISMADIVVIYKEYPHTDINDRAREVFDLAVRAQLGEIRPRMALYDCRMMGMYPTTREPMRGFVESMKEAELRRAVLSVSFGHGFQFADLPHAGAKMLVVTDDDPQLAQEVARELGVLAHSLRRQIGFDAVSIPIEEALPKAMNAARGPVVVADQSDNVGGGAPGDSTYALRWLREHRAENVAIAIVFDPQVVDIAMKAGVGARLPVRLGGKLGVLSGDPVDVDVTVLAMREHYQHLFPQQSGGPLRFPLGNVVALRAGGIDIIVSSERCQCYDPSVFRDLGIDPEARAILVVKSYQHFYSTFSPLAAEVIYMAAPGAVAPDPRQNIYRRLDVRNLYPWTDSPAFPAP